MTLLNYKTRLLPTQVFAIAGGDVQVLICQISYQQ